MPHKGSQETYEFIADWVAPDFFFSKKDVWHRMGFLGVFADYVLSCTQGDVLEIGCGESSIYLSHVARKYDRLMIHCDAAPDKILNPRTVPGYMNARRSIDFMRPSDQLFAEVDIPPLALSFIDGDHHYEQARKDFENAAARTVDNGYILLHDTHPPDASYLSPDSACGDVYLLRQHVESSPLYDAITLPVGTAMGVGLTIVRKKPAKCPDYQA